MIKKRNVILALCLLTVYSVYASGPGVIKLGNRQHWQGLFASTEKSPSGKACVELKASKTARYSTGAAKNRKKGFRKYIDNTQNWLDYWGISFDLFNPTDKTVSVDFKISTPPSRRGGESVEQYCVAKAFVAGKGWHKVNVPFSQFDHPRAFSQVFIYAHTLQMTADRNVLVSDIRVVRGKQVYVDIPESSKIVAPGGKAEYVITVGNSTEQNQAVVINREYHAWEAMKISLSEKEFILAPNGEKKVKVTVSVPKSIPEGGHEKQIVTIVPNGNGDNMVKAEFITGVKVPYPRLLHTIKGWNKVRTKVKNHKWARKAADKYIKKAKRWRVPVVKSGMKSGVTGQRCLFRTTEEHNLMAAAIAWQLTGNKKYAEKVVTFLKRLSDPKTGYPSTLQGCHQALVQEGHFFQHIASAADMVMDSGLIDDKLYKQLAHTMQLYMKTIDMETTSGHISNWNVSELHGAFFCAMFLGDLKKAFFYLETPGGLNDHFSIGCMADGWWYECSISYNTWVASEYSQVAISLIPWGKNYKDKWFAPGYIPNYEISSRGPVKDEDIKRIHYGKSMEKWGKIYKPYVKIKDMWDALVPMIDANSVMFGINDSTERVLGGERYEMAYYIYRDPRYIPIIKNAKERNLLYGVPNLPKVDYKLGTESVSADNAGVMLLRSQTPKRDSDKQIQATLKFGTHGGYHGHFDRTALNSIMRHGRSFFNPEMVWYSYPNFMYAFYVQTSISKNMVTVDRKQQDPQNSKRLLFYKGKKFQAGGAETKAKWSEAPYGGLTYAGSPFFLGKKETLYNKTLWEKRYLPMPKNPPKFGELTGFTEPVLQRRVMVVTDDYIVLSDYVKGSEKHLYECLFQIKGFKGIEAPYKKQIGHNEQWSTNPISAAQFVTDCDIYDVNGITKASFLTKFGKGADNSGTRIYGKDGILNMDIYSVWPKKKQVIAGTAPEAHSVNRKLEYSVDGDGKVIAQGSFGAWVLGRDKINVSLKGVKKLTLKTNVTPHNKRVRTIFWANAVITTVDGKKLKLSELNPEMTNILTPKKSGLDFKGGPVKISGKHFNNVLSGEPKDYKKEALIKLDLKGVNAASLSAEIGGDYPVGNEAERRKTLAFSIPDKEKSARFMTVVEAYDGKAVVKSVKAAGPDTVVVELSDGREQHITVKNITDSKPVMVTLKEYKEGKLIATESSEIKKSEVASKGNLIQEQDKSPVTTAVSNDLIVTAKRNKSASTMRRISKDGKTKCWVKGNRSLKRIAVEPFADKAVYVGCTGIDKLVWKFSPEDGELLGRAVPAGVVVEDLQWGPDFNKDGIADLYTIGVDKLSVWSGSSRDSIGKRSPSMVLLKQMDILSPYSMCFGPDRNNDGISELYIANGKWNGANVDITVINVKDMKVLDTWKISDVRGPSGMIIGPDVSGDEREDIWLVSLYGNRINAYSIVDGKALGAVDLGIKMKQPQDISRAVDGAIYIGTRRGSSLSKAGLDSKYGNVLRYDPKTKKTILIYELEGQGITGVEPINCKVVK